MNKRRKLDLESVFEEMKNTQFEKKKIYGENLELDYYRVFSKSTAADIFRQLEGSLEYLDAESSQVKVFGRWHPIPRQQVAYGDKGLSYRFSGNNIAAKSWTPLLISIRNLINHITGVDFNFVLINRYRNGSDHIGEHKDNEKDLDENAPIASLSLGQQRSFVLKHQDARRTGKARRQVETVKIQLENGSLLLMNPPTNNYWYHSLPPSKKAPGVRINLTFRKMVLS